MFFKKKVTAFDMGTSLVKFISPQESDGLDELPEYTRLDGHYGISYLKISDKIISDEIFCLEIFSILFAVKLTLTDIKTTVAVINAFFKAIKESREFNANEVLDGGKNRYVAYEEAFYTPHHNGHPWNVGKQFSEFCNLGWNFDVIMAGSIIFGVTFEAACKLIKSFKISCA